MTLKDKLTEDMHTAMKAREEGKFRLSVIRLVRAAIKNAEIEKRRELTDEDVLGVLAREIKLRRDAIEMLPAAERANRQDYIHQNEQEIVILQAYLPQQMEPAEIKAMVAEAIAATGAKTVREMGKVMGAIAARIKGRADGRLVNQIVKEMLEQQ